MIRNKIETRLCDEELGHLKEMARNNEPPVTHAEFIRILIRERYARYSARAAPVRLAPLRRVK